MSCLHADQGVQDHAEQDAQEFGILFSDVIDALSYVHLDSSPFRCLNRLIYEAILELQEGRMPLTQVHIRGGCCG